MPLETAKYVHTRSERLERTSEVLLVRFRAELANFKQRRL